MSKKIIDQLERDKIVEELKTNFLVEAGAGSGKTTSLVERIINIIHTGTATVDQIVAITFTRKAADELKVRFQSKLEKVWKQEEDHIKRERLAQALQNIDQCFLGTVHSFCAKLLRERPVEAKLDLHFAELEEEDDLNVLEEAWHLFLKHVQEDREELLINLEKIGISVDDLFNCFKEIREYPDVEWVTDIVPKPELESPFRNLVSVINEAKRSMPVKEPEKGYDKLQKPLNIAIQKLKYLGELTDKDRIDIFELFNKDLKPTYNRWESKEVAVYYFEKINDLMDGSIKALIKAWKEYCHPIIISFLKDAFRYYEQMKNERSLLNFQDLLLNTANLLKTNPEVRKYFQGKYHCLLVDEFQDTDPIQAEIMFYLTSENHQEKNWTKCKPHPGSLFVVGDPKQAIYRFRRADMDTYNRVKQLITAHGGEVLQLTMNFRTVSQVTTELNKLFIEQLPEKETVYQAAYRPLNSYHEDCPELVTGIKSLAIPSDFSKKDEVVLEDGKNIAKCIYYLLENGYQPRDFMVLTRYNDGLTVYSDCLEDLGIPVSVSGEVTIGEMKEFKELAALLEVFVDLTDEVAIVAALRGLFFGISDDELYRWKAAGGNFSIYANPPVDMDEVVIEKFQLAWKKLQKYNKWIRNYSPGTAIEMILEDVGFYPLLIVRQHGTRAYKALLQILSAVRAKEESGSVGYKRIYELINDLIFEKTVVVNLEDDVNAVRIMNIHKAKGLEAPVVFMAHPMKKVSPENFLSMHIKREDIHSKGYFLFKIQKGRQTKVLAIPPEWDTVRQEELRYLTEEEFRIGYVAATRAEKAMIISSSLKNNNKNPWSDILRLDAIESVSIPEMEYKERKKGESFVTFQEYKGVTGNLYDWIEAVKVKSYDTWNPTENKDYQVLTMERESGGGMDWGSVIHDVLEQVVKGSVTSPYVSNTLQKYNQPISREEEVFQYISIFKESSIWEELEQSEEVLTEVPFSLLINSEDNLYQMVKSSDEDSEPRIVKGVIDLAYKREGKWKIVDYKTDRVKTRDDLEQLTVFYQDQVDFYKQVWTRLTGEGVAEAALFFFQKQAIK